MVLKNTYRFLFFTFCFLLGTKSHAQYFEFVENKGQWNKKVNFMTDMKGGAVFLQPGGYKVLLHNLDDLEEISDYYGAHHLSKEDSIKLPAIKKLLPQNILLHSHAYEVNFLGANLNAKAEPDKPLNTYNNYFIGKDSSKWAGHCRIFSAVNFKDLYKDIDIRYYADNGNLKYDLIVKPGADISNIAIKIDGAEKLYINQFGNLAIKTSVGEVYEGKPYCYQVSETGRKKIESKFELKDNILRFKISNYDKKLSLVIDPTLIFSTFVGSRSDNWGYTATYDNAGNLYAGGIVFGSGYPFTTGAFQTVFAGGDGTEGAGLSYDIGIIKLSADGRQRIYGTYLGGSGDEQPHSLVVNSRGELIVSGRTTSSDFPVRSPNYGACGGFDIIISKFNYDGTQLTSSRKFGGDGSDGVNIEPKYVQPGAISIRRNYGDDGRSEVITDNADNIYVASCTQSGNFPTTLGASKKNLGGRQDGVVIKASSDLNTVFGSTYVGGNGDDAVFSLAVSANGDVYAVGGTTSTDLSPTSASINNQICFNNFQGGICDGMIAILDNSCNTIKTSCYAGTNGNDNIYGVQFDKAGALYIMGTTTVAFPVINSQFISQQNGKQFISKLSADLANVIYSTNFGKGQASPDISPTAFLVDVCEQVYVSGWGGNGNALEGYPNASTIGLVTTPNAILTTSDGSDFYFFVLKKDATDQLWGSFFGTDAKGDPSVYGDHVDGGTSRFDKRGVIYQAICANCGKNGYFPVSPPDVWSPNNPATTGSMCNEAAVKIAFELSGVIASIRPSINGVPRDSSGCVPLTVDFADTIALGKSYTWDFGDGSPPVTTTPPVTSHTYNQIGTYRVMLISTDPAKCNISDTTYINIKVKDNKAQLQFLSQRLPPCGSLAYEFTNTSIPANGLSFAPNSFTWNFGDGTTLVSNSMLPIPHTYIAEGIYNVTLTLNDTNFCNAPDSVVLQLRIAKTLVAQFATPAEGCTPYNAVFTNTSKGGQNFIWDFGDGTTSTLTEPTHLYSTPGIYTVKLTAFDNTTCNTQHDTSFTITVHPGPTSDFLFTPNPPVQNIPTDFTNLSSGGIKYFWDFGDGDTLITTDIKTPVSHLYNRTGTYKACLIVTNEFGCTADSCQFVDALVSPVVDVPNAFTPNGDGVNDIVRVRGYGVSKMNWRIFNRWGQLMFQATSLDQFWDGKFKGVLQPQDVYAYVLDIVFTDDTKFQKKGDITLLR